MLSIAIIDTIGLVYDGTTLSKKGLGGSESAIIYMAKELVNQGFSVSVFCNCRDADSSPGNYDGVNYREFNVFKDEKFDIVISSRSVIPFVPKEEFKNFENVPYSFEFVECVRSHAKLKVIWLHDTFCTGDVLLESLVVNGYVDEIFTLSDFQTSYVTNCDHGGKRNFEVLKNHVFHTRNGIKIHKDWVDVTKKDRNLFVYNASVTKGMIPLVTTIWPEVKKHIPDAKLKIIGGYYTFRIDAPKDKQELDWRELYKANNGKHGIEFTGIIPQQEIAEILSQASFFIYPTDFPETFGISTLESLAYNTPIITCRFGAEEETAIENASYMIDYPIKPNGLFQHVNYIDQCNKFIDMTIKAYNDTYLHQQKMHYCNIVKDICEWDSVALQWKQHFYKKLGLYLPIQDYRRVQQITTKVAKVFGKRFLNKEDVIYPKKYEQRIVIITPFYNGEAYIERCIISIAAQNYSNYYVILINDASTDNSYKIADETIRSLHPDVMDNFVITSNIENKGALYNQVNAIIDYTNGDDIVILIDGDDALINNPDIFDMYNNFYIAHDAEFTYGSSWSEVDNIPLIAQPYPPEIKEKTTYSDYKFNWGMPYTHLRTFKSYLYSDADLADRFKDKDGNWFKAGGDNALFYALIERADPKKVFNISDIVYLYNDKNPLNDYKVNAEEQNMNATYIVKTKVKKKILIALPTSRYIEPATFKSIYDLEAPEDAELVFQYFYGYQVDQVRNLISDWAMRNGFDFVFSVDHDITFPPDTLKKLYSHNLDIVSGLYIQRIPGQSNLELFGPNGRIDYEDIYEQGVVEIEQCGFGCVLVKTEIFKTVGYPQFEYHSALNHADTFSEDADFCKKAKLYGYKVWADTSVICNHIGSATFTPQIDHLKRLRKLGEQRLLPRPSVEYLYKLKEEGFEPKVIYDIGSCVLHWTREAKNVWPAAEYYLFEAMQDVEPIYQEHGYQYHLGVLSDEDNKQVEFYQNTIHPGGNSYYKENIEVNPEADKYYNESHKRLLLTKKLDNVIKERSFPTPALIKIDVQGAELDILRGAELLLKTPDVTDIIVELQHTEYNKGAPGRDAVIEYLGTLGFNLINSFSMTRFDGDYHFSKMVQSKRAAVNS